MFEFAYLILFFDSWPILLFDEVFWFVSELQKIKHIIQLVPPLKASRLL